MAPWTRQRCEELDETDPLAHVRERFFLDDDLVYLDGNSLGALPRAVPERLRHVIEQEWGVGLVRQWDDWMSVPDRVGDKIGRLIGAAPGEVVAIDTTTIAVVKMLGAALSARPGRRAIVTTATNFPTDLYAANAVASLFDGVEIRYADPANIEAALDDEVATLLLTHVDFRTGAMFDMATLTSAAHEAGALAVWDLCHSVGAVAVDCTRDGVDLALGCCYKYLNGGPGAPAFVFVRRDLQASVANPLPGWLGHETPFAFSNDYRPEEGIRRFITSSPPILGLTALDAALDAFEGVPIEAVRKKSVALTELFIEAVTDATGEEFELASPRDPRRRGSQVSFRHEHAYEIIQALIARGVVGDFRAPDICRFGFTPLYLRYVDVFDAVATLTAVMEAKEYEAAAGLPRRAVT
jgi:kynureninase